MSPSALPAVLANLGVAAVTEAQAAQFDQYLSLILKWNGKVSLTAIRAEADIVRRHFAESIQCARSLPTRVEDLLDYGSGAGFPGVPCAICRPEIRVTLAESQMKKATFLREVVRTLDLRVTVHAARVETLPPEKTYGAVTLRAVDHMGDACAKALTRLKTGGSLVVLCSLGQIAELSRVQGLLWRDPLPLLGTRSGRVLIGERR